MSKYIVKCTKDFDVPRTFKSVEGGVIIKAGTLFSCDCIVEEEYVPGDKHVHCLMKGGWVTVNLHISRTKFSRHFKVLEPTK